MSPDGIGTRTRRKVRLVPLIIVISLLRVVTSQPPLYPFDVSGDTRTEKLDDGGSPVIELDIDFPFYNTNYRNIYEVYMRFTDLRKVMFTDAEGGGEHHFSKVNNNGLISFLEQLKSYKPQNFPTVQDIVTPFVAAFWADVDIQHVIEGDFNESVLFRVTADSAILKNATTDVRTHFIGQEHFTAKIVIIVTWYNVGFYGATKTGKHKRNLFQAVLTTDSVASFAIFNYDTIVWTTGANSAGDSETGLGGSPAVVGFHSGRSGTFYNSASSGTDGVVNVTRGSNVDVIGRYMYRIDGAKIDDLNCSSSGYIEIFPKTWSMLGREEVKLTGPCFRSSTPLRGRIAQTDFTCAITGSSSAICVTPTIFRTGEVTLEIDGSEHGWTYTTTIISTHIAKSTPAVMRERVDKWSMGKTVTAHWDGAGAVPPDVEKELQVMAYSGSGQPPVFYTMQKFLVEPTVTSRRFKLLSSYSNYNTLVMRLCWNNERHPDTLKPCIWSDVFPVRWNSHNSKESEQWCENWLHTETTLSKIVINKPNCPCVLTMAENDLGHFHVDPFCDKRKTSSDINCVYNSNAQQCMRRNIKSAAGSGELCCYDNDGELMNIRDINGTGSGTHQRFHYEAQDLKEKIVPYFSYFESDLLPRLHCCQYSNTNCGDFTVFRKPTSCSGYSPPSPAQAAGDPHIVTLDGKRYSFNGVGNFILVTDVASNLVIQVRAEQTVDAKGDRQNATVFTHVAVTLRDSSDVIEIRKRDDGGADVLVNGTVHNVDTTTSQFRNISLVTNSTNEGSYLIVLEPLSVSVTAEVTPDLLNIIILIGEDSLKGNLLGLLGNYNGQPDDDFVARNGTTLPASSSMSRIHYEFGMSWEVTAEESILSSLHLPLMQDSRSYVPFFIDDMTSDSLRNGTVEICGDNLQCTFDYQVTGKESVAKSTATFTNKFEALKKELEKKVIRCEFLEMPPNGNRTVSGYSNGSMATYTCHLGYVMLSGDKIRICQDDGTWTGSDAVCAEKVVQESDGVNVAVVAAASGGGAMFVVIVIFFVIWITRKRRKPKEESPIEMSNIPVFQNPAFMHSLQGLVKEGAFRIPRPNFVDPNIFNEYF